MDFNLTEDQSMLQDGLTRLLRDRYDWDTRVAAAYEAPFHIPAAWDALAEMGVPGMLVPEAAGGYGGTGFDITTVFEPLGRALSVEPMLGAAMIGAVLPAGDPDAEAIVAGTAKVAPALWEVDGALETAVIDGKISGRKSVVPQGGIADLLLVSAMEEGEAGLWVVRASDAQITSYATIEGGGAAEVILTDAPCRKIGGGDALARAEQAGIVAICAEGVGVMTALHDMTLEYLKTRQQFGTTIGSFQALQHRMVDMSIAVEMARSIVIRAAASLGTDQAARHASMAKNLVGRAGQQLAEEAIQMHGGIAMTWEAAVSHYAKRMTMIDAYLGDRDDHLARLMAS